MGANGPHTGRSADFSWDTGRSLAKIRSLGTLEDPKRRSVHLLVRGGLKISRQDPLPSRSGEPVDLNWSIRE